MSVQYFSKAALGCASLGVLALTLAGCGNNIAAPSPSKELVSFGGSAYGGPSPVVGATVTLYATGSTGYGAAGTVLGTTTTLADGSFNFVTGSLVACPAGSQAYITSKGGNPGSGINPNYLLMAAIGQCSSITSSTFVRISEATTVVAAYALRPFTTINTSATVPVTQIGAPANNNATTGVCGTTGAGTGATTTCTAAGLTHAFQNAANLINAVGTFGAQPTGNIYQVTQATNSNGQGVIPTAMLNSLANSVEACVNSTGGAAGDGTPCGNLFLYTTPPVTNAAAPTNTLQAMLNVAQYPALTATNVTNLFNMAPATSFYTPALTAAPTDFSLAIAYPAEPQPVPPAGAVTSVTLTNNDTATVSATTPASGVGYATPAAAAPVFSAPPAGGTTATGTAVLGITYFAVTSAFPKCPDQAGTTESVTIGTGSGSGGAVSLSFDSTGTAISPANVTATGTYTAIPTFTIANCTNAGAVVAQGAAQAKLKTLGVIGVTITNGGAGYTSAPTVTFPAPISTATGAPAASLVQAVGTAVYTAAGTAAPLAAPYAISLDANDNVYVMNQNVSGATAQNSFLTAMGSNGALLFNSTPSTTYTLPRGAMTDTLGNLWFSSNDTTSVVELNTTTGAQTGVFSASSVAPFGIAIDKANNVWYGIAPGKLTQNLFELQQAAATPYTPVTFATLPLFPNAIRSLAFGPLQNVHVNGYGISSNSVGGFGNSGTATTPAYGTTAAFSQTLTGQGGPGIALDASSNSYSTTSTGLYVTAPVYGANSVNGLSTQLTGLGTPVQVSALANLGYDEVDGSGNVWVGTTLTTGVAGQTVVQYNPTTATATSFAPCYAAAGATTCASVNLNLPQRVQVDSTGSVWITSVQNGRVYQMLGTGYPTWPQLSLGAPGVAPQ